MPTVGDLQEAFWKKGIEINFPLDVDVVITRIECLEKKVHPQGEIDFLFAVSFRNTSGKHESKTFDLKGFKKKENRVVKKPARYVRLFKKDVLPLKDEVVFHSEPEAYEYLDRAVTHLLVGEGYSKEGNSKGGESVDLLFKKGDRRFFVCLAVRCSEKTTQDKVDTLVELSEKYGTLHDYGLFMPAFQESLGIPLRKQELWIIERHELLGKKNIGVFGVDNQNPNRIYPFTTYPMERGLKSYFINTFGQWRSVRERYVTWERSKLS